MGCATGERIIKKDLEDEQSAPKKRFARAGQQPNGIWPGYLNARYVQLNNQVPQ
jgi:hypothetical protein